MANGEIAIERLVQMSKSAQRISNTINEELARRSQYDDYTDSYLGSLLQLGGEVGRLEDHIRTMLK